MVEECKVKAYFSNKDNQMEVFNHLLAKAAKVTSKQFQNDISIEETHHLMGIDMLGSRQVTNIGEQNLDTLNLPSFEEEELTRQFIFDIFEKYLLLRACNPLFAAKITPLVKDENILQKIESLANYKLDTN